MNVRRPVYEAVATLRVDTAGRTPEDVAAEIAACSPRRDQEPERR